VVEEFTSVYLRRRLAAFLIAEGADEVTSIIFRHRKLPTKVFALWSLFFDPGERK